MNSVDKSIFPSFSIVIETENLSSAEIAGLEQCLDSLICQSVSPTTANEVLLLNSGDTPQELVEQICSKYTWLKPYQLPEEVDYYESKMRGAALVTGEILLYADSDCIYKPNWIESLLMTYAQRPDIQLLAGETGLRGSGPYVLAMSLAYFFDGFSGREDLYESPVYYFNNVSFRRNFLLNYPIPHQLPLYRGHCSIHTRLLLAQGYKIWRQPQAQAGHAAPNGFSHFFWRFLLVGRDNVLIQRLLTESNFSATIPKRASGFQKFFPRLKSAIKENPQQIWHIPLALPITGATMMLVYIGYIISSIWPDYLLKLYSRVEGTNYRTLEDGFNQTQLSILHPEESVVK